MKRQSDPDVLLLQAAADPTRLSILRQLSAAGPGLRLRLHGLLRGQPAHRVPPPEGPSRGRLGQRRAARNLDLVLAAVGGCGTLPPPGRRDRASLRSPGGLPGRGIASATGGHARASVSSGVGRRGSIPADPTTGLPSRRRARHTGDASAAQEEVPMPRRSAVLALALAISSVTLGSTPLFAKDVPAADTGTGGRPPGGALPGARHDRGAGGPALLPGPGGARSLLAPVPLSRPRWLRGWRPSKPTTRLPTSGWLP